VRKEASSAVRKVGGRRKRDEGEMEKTMKRGLIKKKEKEKREEAGRNNHPSSPDGYTTGGSRPH
jgi:hypothetical protein